MVTKRTLLLFAGCVWCIAGFNILKIGIECYQNIEITPTLLLLSCIVAFLFLRFVFWKMTNKHQARILSYEEKRPFYQFFDGKAYLIMTIMMSGGISIRFFHLLSDTWIAFFYSGLSVALLVSGVRFLYAWMKRPCEATE